MTSRASSRITRPGSTIIHQMQQILVDDVPYIIPYYQKNVQAYRTDTFTGWDETLGPLGLEDPASLSVISQAQ